MRQEVTKIVARWTGIPVQRLVEGEREKRLRMQDILHRRVVAQDEAVGLVADALIRARSGAKDPQKPICSFVFGARPLKRFLQHELETRIARALVDGAVVDGSRLVVELVEEGEQVVHCEQLEAAAVAAY